MELEATRLEGVAACDLCGSTKTGPPLITADRLHRLPGQFALVRCDGCGLGRLSPRPALDELGRYYPDEEYYVYQDWSLPKGNPRRLAARVREALRDETLAALGYARPRHRWAAPVARALHRRLVTRLAHGQRGFPRWVPGGRALDVGCGNGFFLAIIREYGWQVQGLDMSAAAAAAAKRNFGIDVQVADIEHADLPPASFDFLHMTHVVEHVPSPTATLARVRGLLKPGGFAYIETPNLDSYGFRTFGTRWLGLDSPRHLWLFDPGTFRRAVLGAGFDIDTLFTLTRSEFSWEMTFAAEERAGRPRSDRPALTEGERAAVLGHRLRAGVRHRRDPLSGDFLAVWAVRPTIS